MVHFDRSPDQKLRNYSQLARWWGRWPQRDRQPTSFNTTVPFASLQALMMTALYCCRQCGFYFSLSKTFKTCVFSFKHAMNQLIRSQESFINITRMELSSTWCFSKSHFPYTPRNDHISHQTGLPRKIIDSKVPGIGDMWSHYYTGIPSKWP